MRATWIRKKASEDLLGLLERTQEAVHLTAEQKMDESLLLSRILECSIQGQRIASECVLSWPVFQAMLGELGRRNATICTPVGVGSRTGFYLHEILFRGDESDLTPIGNCNKLSLHGEGYSWNRYAILDEDEFRDYLATIRETNGSFRLKLLSCDATLPEQKMEGLG